MNCPRCQQDKPPHAKFCLECGVPFQPTHESGPAAASYTDLQRALTEALEQQRATSEILRVISGSPTDLQLVFVAIVRSAQRLLGAHSAAAFQLIGDLVHRVAATVDGPGPATLYPMPLGQMMAANPAAGRVWTQAELWHVTDTESDAYLTSLGRSLARSSGYRSLLWIPLVRDCDVVGVIAVTRPAPGGFTDAEIALLQTFADQAVIAIENVRLFNETKEALERQTATGDILRVISSSPTDAQPAFEAIAESAGRLMGAVAASVYEFDGTLVHLRTVTPASWPHADELRRQYPRPPDIDLAAGRVILERTILHLADLQTDPATPSVTRQVAERMGLKSVLWVPMLRNGAPIGVIGVVRATAGLFSEKQVGLLKTFADQAVIALENVRLFTETKEALERQTATAEILRVISSSPTNMQPVMDAVAENAARVCGAADALIFHVAGGALHRVAQFGSLAVNIPSVRRISRETPPGRAILERRTIHIEDIVPLLEAEYPLVQEAAIAIGARTHLAAPLMREGVPIGAILIRRTTVQPFTDRQIELLETFAAQAVIAIENVRLFNELEARTADLTRSVEQLTALGEVGRAVSSTLDLETVLSTIVSRAVELTGLDGGVVLEYNEDEQVFVHRAQAETGGALAAARRATRIRKGEGVVGRTAITLEPLQVSDITAPGAYASSNRENLIASGVRAILAVPMVREGQLIGCLGVTRNQPGEFRAEIVDLLRTFATQSALAIQNARLFQEIEDKSRQLEAASRHKSEFLANMSHELRTPLNAIIGFSEVLSERMFGDLNDKQEEYLKDIHASGQHLLSLINDILDLSKIEAGRMELELTDFDLPAAIDNALTLVRERAGRRGIALHHAVDERLGRIRGDERKIKQVFLNLLSNAIKFTPEGGRVDVRAALVDGMAEVAVADTGVGIAPEDQGAVFEEFRQVGTADKKVEGTGLGLTLSRKFVELHGGRIWVKSQVGAGSTFTFTIPIGQT